MDGRITEVLERRVERKKTKQFVYQNDGMSVSYICEQIQTQWVVFSGMSARITACIYTRQC